MSQVISREMITFLLSVGYGAFLAFLYDLLRSLRRAISHNLIILSTEDFLYWIMIGILTFGFAFFQTSGVIRGYEIAGIGAGAILYHYSISAWIVLIIYKILCVLSWTGIKIRNTVRRILSDPLKKICLIFKKRIEFAKKRGYNGTNRNKVRSRCHGRKKTSQ